MLWVVLMTLAWTTLKLTYSNKLFTHFEITQGELKWCH